MLQFAVWSLEVGAVVGCSGKLSKHARVGSVVSGTAVLRLGGSDMMRIAVARKRGGGDPLFRGLLFLLVFIRNVVALLGTVHQMIKQ